MLAGRDRPEEVTTDLAAPLLHVVDDLLPDVLHDTIQYANNRIECDHDQLKSRLRPMRGLRTDRTAATVIRAMRLCRTYDVATTCSASKHATTGYVSQPPSTNSPQRSDGAVTSSALRCALDRSTQQCPWAGADPHLRRRRRTVNTPADVLRSPTCALLMLIHLGFREAVARPAVAGTRPQMSRLGPSHGSQQASW